MVLQFAVREGLETFGLPDAGPEGARSPLWNDRLLIGHPTIDHEHMQLFLLVSQLFDADVPHRSRDVVSNVLCTMADYALIHFGHEEHFMVTSHYPLYLVHAQHHSRFITKLSVLINDYEQGSVDVLPGCKSFLVDWLLTHISVDDRTFGDFLIDENLALLPSAT